MQFEYTPIVKDQKDNPFWKMRARDQSLLEKELYDRLIFISQLGSSKDEIDRAVYDALVNTRSKKEFGSAPWHGNQPNTGVSALAGAVDKLRKGDLSRKQVEHIEYTLELLAKAYPHKFSNITFVERGEANIKVHLSDLFEVIND
jgi:hypothetical protein